MIADWGSCKILARREAGMHVVQLLRYAAPTAGAAGFPRRESHRGPAHPGQEHDQKEDEGQKGEVGPTDVCSYYPSMKRVFLMI